MKVKQTKVELYKELIALDYDDAEFLMQIGTEASKNKEFHQWLAENAFHWFMQMSVLRETPDLVKMSKAERHELVKSIRGGNINI